MMLRTHISRLLGDTRGVSAVEFALVAPMMVGLYLGCSEFTHGFSVDRKAMVTCDAVANLVAQNKTVSTADINNFFDAATSVMSPYSTSTLTIVVTSVAIDSSGRATVSWSKTKNGTARSVGAAVTLPSALAVPSSSLILSEVTYRYQPSIGYSITGALTLSKTTYSAPRQSSSVAFSS